MTLLHCKNEQQVVSGIVDIVQDLPHGLIIGFYKIKKCAA
jgi:hypothetical protein